MSFWETFGAVFTATLIGQIAIWIVQRYILTHFNFLADKIDKPLKKRLKKIIRKKDYSKSVLFGNRK